MKLIQHATVPSKTTWKQEGKLKSLLRVLHISHTGLPEFSDGAIPDALLRFINDRACKTFGSITLRTGELLRNATEEQKNKRVTIHYLIREEQESQLLDMLERWSEQPPKLRVPVSPAAPKAMLFCIDKGEEAFIWTATQGRQLLEETLPVSARTFRQNGHTLRPTATTLDGILNSMVPVVEDRYSRMEN
jgi:hypothetical protein